MREDLTKAHGRPSACPSIFPYCRAPELHEVTIPGSHSKVWQAVSDNGCQRGKSGLEYESSNNTRMPPLSYSQGSLARQVSDTTLAGRERLMLAPSPSLSIPLSLLPLRVFCPLCKDVFRSREQVDAIPSHPASNILNNHPPRTWLYFRNTIFANSAFLTR